MTYPPLKSTPIREIVFSISYNEIIENDCFDKFIKIEEVKNRFDAIRQSIALEINAGKADNVVSHQNDGYYLKNDKEVLHMRKGLLSYHYLNNYNDFDSMMSSAVYFWNSFRGVVESDLTISSVSVRYINEIKTDGENLESRLVQLYPQQSTDRDILNYQNYVTFRYKNSREYLVNVVSTKSAKDKVLLDITVRNEVNNENQKAGIQELFNPLREIKNRVFFDSITAQALVQYIN